MRIEATRQVTNHRLDNTAPDESPQDSVNQETVNGGRALVAVEAPHATASTGPYRQAVFLAHLIATREQAPQTRERRRADPAEAAAAYRAMAALAVN